MYFRNALYFLGEAWKGLFKNGWMSLASIGVVAFTLLMLGVFCLLNVNVQHWSQVLKDQVEMAVYIDDEATYEQRARIETAVNTHSLVNSVKYVTKEEGFARLQAQLGGRADLLEGYDNKIHNPLRDSFEVRAKQPEQIPQIAQDLKDLPGVGDIFYSSDVVNNLTMFIRAMQYVAIGLMMALAFMAAFLVSHTIRLTVMLRQKEIMIMKYVGATDWFIRWPFLLGGVNLGILGAVIPLVGLYFGYGYLLHWAQYNLFFLPMVSLQKAFWEATIMVAPLGLALGTVGSMFSIARFLKV